MGGLLTFVLVFVLTSQALAFAIALISRVWVLHTEPVVLHGIEKERARDLVATYVESLHDTRFGFPTGVFRVDTAQITPEQVIAREVNFHGSSGFQLARFAMIIPTMFVEAASDEGCAVGAIALFLGIMFAIFFVVPIVLISIIEVVLRALMRSRIIAKVESVPSEENACSVQFELAGLSAFGARKPLMRGLTKPSLPPRFGGADMQTSSEPWHTDRLNQVYLAGSVIALAVAVTVVASSPRIGGTGQYTPAGTYAGQVSEANATGTEGTTSSAETTSTSTTSAPAPLPAPSRTIRMHLERLGSGNYAGAFALMSAAYRSANPSWVENRTEADPVIDIIDVAAPSYSNGSAWVYVKFYARDRNPTKGSDTQCRLFSGVVNVIDHHGMWRYEPGNGSLSAQVQPQSDPHCDG